MVAPKLYKRSPFSMGAEGQLKMIINGNFLPAQTLFHKNGFLNSFGGYNENYGYEDWPMWITLLEKGERLYSFGATTIAYRHHFESLSTHKVASLTMFCRQKVSLK